jgi:hypothetical protein
MGTKRSQKRPDIWVLNGECKKIKILSMVEAAGVEPDIGTENTQVTDTENA